MKTKTIGQILREEREFHRLSLEEMAQRTRIRITYLKALESDQYDVLPASTFVKGYTRTYGELFGFNYHPLLAMLRRDYRESAEGALVPQDFIKPVLRRRAPSAPITYLMLGLVTVFCVLIGYIGLQWWRLQQPPRLIISEPTENQVVAPELQVIGLTSPDAIVLVNDQPVALQLDGSFTTQLTLSREGLTTITIEATDRRGRTSLEQRTVRVKF